MQCADPNFHHLFPSFGNRGRKNRLQRRLIGASLVEGVESGTGGEEVIRRASFNPVHARLAAGQPLS